MFPRLNAHVASRLPGDAPFAVRAKGGENKRKPAKPLRPVPAVRRRPKRGKERAKNSTIRIEESHMQTVREKYISEIYIRSLVTTFRNSIHTALRIDGIDRLNKSRYFTCRIT